MDGVRGPERCRRDEGGCPPADLAHARRDLPQGPGDTSGCSDTAACSTPGPQTGAVTPDRMQIAVTPRPPRSEVAGAFSKLSGPQAGKTHTPQKAPKQDDNQV